MPQDRGDMTDPNNKFAPKHVRDQAVKPDDSGDGMVAADPIDTFAKLPNVVSVEVESE